MIGSKWNVFKEGFETYLNSQKGHGTIHLSYVIRVLNGVNPLEMYETEHEQLTKTVHCLVLTLLLIMGMCMTS